MRGLDSVYGRIAFRLPVLLWAAIFASVLSAPADELRLEPVSGDAVVGGRLRLQMQVSAQNWEDLEIEAVLISPQLEVSAVELSGEALVSGKGTAYGHFTPQAPGEYDLSVIMRGAVDDGSRSIRRSLRFYVYPGAALYIEGWGEDAFDAGSAYAGETAGFSIRAGAAETRGRFAAIHISELEGPSRHIIDVESFDISPETMAVSELPADIGISIGIPRNLPPGIYRGEVAIESETDRTALPFEIEVLQPRISLSQSKVGLGSIRRGEVGSAELVIGLHGGVQPFGVTLQPWISRSGGKGPGMFVEGLDRKFTLRDGEQETIAVTTYAPDTAATGKYFSMLVIETPQSTLEVPVEARVIRAPISARQALFYGLAALIAVLLLALILDIIRSAGGYGLTPLQRFLLLSALAHALLLLLSAYLFFDSAAGPERDRVAVRAVRIAGEQGLQGGTHRASESFAGELEELEYVTTESPAEVARAVSEHAEQRVYESQTEEDPAEGIRRVNPASGRAADAEVVEDIEEAGRSFEFPHDEPALDMGEVDIRHADGAEVVEDARSFDIGRVQVADERPGVRLPAVDAVSPDDEPGRYGAKIEAPLDAGGGVIETPVETSQSFESPHDEPELTAGRMSLREAAEPDITDTARALDVVPVAAAAVQEDPPSHEPVPLQEDYEMRRSAAAVLETSVRPDLLGSFAAAETPGLGDPLSGGVILIGHGIYEGDWDCELSAMPNLAYQIEKRTALAVEAETRFVRLGSEDIFQCAFLFMTGHLDFRFRDEEIERLRKYLYRGGSLWINDSTHEGDNTFDRAARREIQRLVPERSLETIPMDSPLFTACYDLSGGYLGYDIPPGDKYRENRLRGIRVDDRWAIVYTRNDYGDGLEIDPNTHPLMKSLTDLSPHEMQEGSIRMGMNLAFYFLGGDEPDEARERQLARMRRSAAEVPEIEAQLIRQLEGRPYVPALQAMEVTEDWHVAADWSEDPTFIETGGDGAIRLELHAGEAGKNVVGKYVHADLSDYRWLAMEVNSVMEAGARLAVGLSMGEEFAYFESAPQYIRPGRNLHVVFDLQAGTFKTESAGWEYNAFAVNLQDVRAIHLLFYPISAGSLQVENIRLVQ